MQQFIELNPENLCIHAGTGDQYQAARESLLAGLKEIFIGDDPARLVTGEPATGEIEVAGLALSDLLNLLTQQGWELILASPRKFLLQRNTAELFRAIISPEQIARFTFDKFVPEGYGLNDERRRNLRMAYDMAYNFAQQPEGWLVFLGNDGCGKTHLAAAIVNHAISQGQPALFVSVPDLLDYLRGDSYSPSTLDRRFDQLCTAPLLALDDLRMHNSTPGAQEELSQLFNYRYNAQLPTIVTSSVPLEEIEIRIRSRLVDPDLSQIIKILAPDFRQIGVIQRGRVGSLSTLSIHAGQTFEAFSLRQAELDRAKAESLKWVFDKARAYAKRPEGWLVFSGSFGCGKTHLAAAVANEAAKLGREAIFTTTLDLLDYLWDIFNPNNHNFCQDFNELRDIELLIVDDLRPYKVKRESRERLFQLLDYRHSANRPTVITLADGITLDPRLKTRLLDVGRCTPLQISAPAYQGLFSKPRRPIHSK